MGTATKECKPLATVLLDYLLTASTSELIAASKVLIGEIRRRQKSENVKALAQFVQNDRVQLKEEFASDKLPGGAVGIVKRLGIKNVVVDFGVYRTFRVPAGWIEQAPENASFQPRASNALTPPRRRAASHYEETPPDMA